MAEAGTINAAPGIDGPGRMGRIRHIHFVGVGGAGMSGIAEVMNNLGYTVSGTDLADNATTRRLASLGVAVQQGHHPAAVMAADVVVTSSAVDEGNAEVMWAREHRIPIVPRAQMLAELMRFRQGIAVAGTHGKTTTTSLVASVLGEGGLDPTFVIGGQLNSAGANARLGTGQYLVAEADESDASFLHLQPVMAVVTNIDADHMATYGGDFEHLRHAFDEFLQQLPFYGLAVMCIDDPMVRAMVPDLTRPALTYGFAAEADVRAVEVVQEGVRTRFTVEAVGRGPFAVTLNLPGRHNVQNALAAIAVGLELGVPPALAGRALEGFEGIGRRFQVHREVPFRGGAVTLVDDYAHHPTEIAATLAAVRDGWPERRVTTVFQPHRYTRTHDLLDDFARVLCDTERLILLEVYAAGEEPIGGADGRGLSRAIRARGLVDPVFVADLESLDDTLTGVLEDGDVLLVLGAGSIGAVARRLAATGVGTGRDAP